MTLNDLNDRWNELKNAVIGRDGKPTIPDVKLANEIARWSARWRVWWTAQGPTSDLVPSIAAANYIEVLRQLQARAASAGVLDKSEVLPETVPETITSAIVAIPKIVIGVSLALAVAALALTVAGGRRNG